MDVHIAIKSARAVVHVLVGVPPSVPPRSVPLVSVVRSSRFKPQRGYGRWLRWTDGQLVWQSALWQVFHRVAGDNAEHAPWHPDAHGVRGVGLHHRQCSLHPKEEGMAVCRVSWSFVTVPVSRWCRFFNFSRHGASLFVGSVQRFVYIAQVGYQ